MKVMSEKQLPAASGDEGIAAAEIVFTKSGKTLTWHEGEGSILEFAEANDLDPAYSCRAGICGTCQCKIQAGEVTYQEPPTAEIDEGAVLICISKPKTAKVVLDL
jgi:ferredoxin